MSKYYHGTSYSNLLKIIEDGKIKTSIEGIVYLAKTKEEAMELVQDLIETKQLVPSETYDGHEITVDFAEEVKNG